MKDTGGQAFPLPCTSDVAGGVHWAEEGMTLRQYIAIKAMQSIISKDKHHLLNANESHQVFSQVAIGAYEYADAMILEGNK